MSSQWLIQLGPTPTNQWLGLKPYSRGNSYRLVVCYLCWPRAMNKLTGGDCI